MNTFKQFFQETAQPALKASERNKVNNKLHALGSYHEKIPLQDIFDILAEIGVHAVQEDGTPWQGMLIGGKECGPEAADQVANFYLVRTTDGSPLDNSLRLTWCKMPSGRYEIVAYVS